MKLLLDIKDWESYKQTFDKRFIIDDTPRDYPCLIIEQRYHNGGYGSSYVYILHTFLYESDIIPLTNALLYSKPHMKTVESKDNPFYVRQCSLNRVEP